MLINAKEAIKKDFVRQFNGSFTVHARSCWNKGISVWCPKL